MKQNAEIVFWISFALLLYTYIGYPVLMALLAAIWKKPQRKTGYEPVVSVMIAAYNEQASIKDKVRKTLALDYPPEKLNVVVVSDGSSDGTDKIMTALSAGEPRVSFYRVARGGKTLAQNFGAAQCRGEIIVFSDATSIYEPDAIRRLVEWFVSPDIGAVSGVCRFYDPAHGESPTGMARSLYGGYEQSIRLFQSTVHTATACSGPIYAVRCSAYVRLPGHACSDMEEPLEIVRKGQRVLYAPDAIAWEATTKSVDDEFRMRVRVTTQGIQGLIDAGTLLAPWKFPWVSFQILSHKFLRYFLPVPFTLILVTNVMILDRPYGPWLLAGQIVFYGLAALALLFKPERRPKLLNLPLYFCVLNLAIVASVWQALRGNRFAVWETVRD